MAPASEPTPADRRREEILARVIRQQEELHPAPVYSPVARRGLRAWMVLIWPLGVVLGWLLGIVVGWSTLERLGFGVGLGMTLGYIGFVLLAERDDGRIHRRVRSLLHHDSRGPGAAG